MATATLSAVADTSTVAATVRLLSHRFGGNLPQAERHADMQARIASDEREWATAAKWNLVCASLLGAMIAASRKAVSA